MKTKKLKNLYIGLLVSTLMLLGSSEVLAQPKVIWCSQWLTNFVDSSGPFNEQEDWFWEKGTVRRTAHRAAYIVYVKFSNMWIPGYSGYLNDEYNGYGCTPALDVAPGGSYKIAIFSRLKRDNREITIMTDASTWANPSAWSFYREYDISPSLNQTIRLHVPPYDPADFTKQSSGALVARQVMALAPTLGYPNSSNEKILVNMDPAECRGARYLLGFRPHRVCYATDAGAISKFVLGHELGHAVSAMNNGPLHTNYGADDPSSGSFWIPSTLHCQGHGSEHNLQSREYIGAAQGEGFAHAFSAALFNAREPNAGYKYYKKVYYTPPGETSPRWVYEGPWIGLGDSDRRIKTFCCPSTSTMGERIGLGTEWDWSQFYWQIWAQGSDTQKWTMSEIYELWSMTPHVTLTCVSSTACWESSNGAFNVGKTYEKISDSMWEKYRYNYSKRVRFITATANTKVKYND